MKSATGLIVLAYRKVSGSTEFQVTFNEPINHSKDKKICCTSYFSFTINSRTNKFLITTFLSSQFKYSTGVFDISLPC